MGFRESQDRGGRGPEPDSGYGPTDPGQAPDPHPVPEADVFVFTAFEGPGQSALPWGSDELTLVFDARGIAIRGAAHGDQPARPWTSVVFPWASVTRFVRGSTEVAPDGRTSTTAIDIEASGRSMRFAMRSPGRDPVRLTAWSEQVQRWAARDDGGDEGAGAPREAPVRPPRTVPALFLSEPVAPPPPAPAAEPGAARPSGSDRAERRDPVEARPPATSEVRPSPALPAPPSAPSRRRRRIAGLVVALVVVVAGSGFALAHALSGTSGSPASIPAPSTALVTPDQALADRVVLGARDLPVGWTATSDSGGPGASSKVQSAESRITAAFAQCMGIDDAQASAALGGGADDQTAQRMSPVFVGPPVQGRPGYALELQTAADIVRTHQEELQDFALFADARYPACAGIAVASETQLGADSAARTSRLPGPSSASPIPVPAMAGEQASGLLVTFNVSDGSQSVPVELITISLGYDRIEANLQALAIGGQIPAGAITSPLSDFEQRVVEAGAGTQA